MSIPDLDVINEIVSSVFRTTDVTAGVSGSEYLARYRGELTLDSMQAYDLLTERLRPYGLMPLFRKGDDGGHVILVTVSMPEPRPSRVWINLVLFILTVASVIWTGMNYAETDQLAGATSDAQIWWLAFLHAGLPFAVSLLAILLAHEFGHYFVTRRHNTAATLPYFIPFPSLLGTMGAVIVWKELPRNKRVLFDVGIAGPLAGLVVAIPVVIYGLFLSKTGPVNPAAGGFIEGNSILYLLAKYAVFGRLLPAPESYGTLSPLLYWVKFYLTGTPIPTSGTDVFISPVAMAGWAGLLVTSMNLVPAGQLDGGHVMYVLFGKKLKYALPVIIAVLLVLGYFWNGWWLWVALLALFGRQSADPLDQITELDPARKIAAWLMILVFMLVFIPVPLISFG